MKLEEDNKYLCEICLTNTVSQNRDDHLCDECALMLENYSSEEYTLELESE